MIRRLQEGLIKASGILEKYPGLSETEVLSIRFHDCLHSYHIFKLFTCNIIFNSAILKFSQIPYRPLAFLIKNTDSVAGFITKSSLKKSSDLENV